MPPHNEKRYTRQKSEHDIATRQTHVRHSPSPAPETTARPAQLQTLPLRRRLWPRGRVAVSVPACHRNERFGRRAEAPILGRGHLPRIRGVAGWGGRWRVRVRRCGHARRREGTPSQRRHVARGHFSALRLQLAGTAAQGAPRRGGGWHATRTCKIVVWVEWTKGEAGGEH